MNMLPYKNRCAIHVPKKNIRLRIRPTVGSKVTYYADYHQASLTHQRPASIAHASRKCTVSTTSNDPAHSMLSVIKLMAAQAFSRVVQSTSTFPSHHAKKNQAKPPMRSSKPPDFAWSLFRNLKQSKIINRSWNPKSYKLLKTHIGKWSAYHPYPLSCLSHGIRRSELLPKASRR